MPVFTTCFGPRTAAAGFIGTTWPITSQSNSMRTAASCCFTLGAECSLQFLHPGGHVERPNGREREAALLAPGEEPAASAGVSPARVVVVDVGGEEFDIAPAGLIAEIGDERRHYIGVGRDGERAREKHGGQLLGHGNTEATKRSCINRLVASSTKASSVHVSPRSSNHACSDPSICTSSPRHSRRRRGWCGEGSL